TTVPRSGVHRIPQMALASARSPSRAVCPGGAQQRGLSNSDHGGALCVDEVDNGLELETADECDQLALVDHGEIEAFAFAADIYPDPSCHGQSIARLAPRIYRLHRQSAGSVAAAVQLRRGRLVLW